MNSHNPDPDEQKKLKFSINDLLALERTSMANERTFLAYIRTSLTFIVPGVTGVQLADTPFLRFVSIMFVPIGIIVFFIGAGRFYKKRKTSQLIKGDSKQDKGTKNATWQ